MGHQGGPSSVDSLLLLLGGGARLTTTFSLRRNIFAKSLRPQQQISSGNVYVGTVVVDPS